MGVNLTPIIVKERIELSDLGGRSLAVDANNELYQFLSLIRQGDGTPLSDGSGHVTSHLVGLMFRSTRLIHDYSIKLIFVFDGKPSALKVGEIAKRREAREKALTEWREALSVGDYARAFSKAVASSRLSKPLVDDAKRLLDLLGIPYAQAPGEAEAQAAYMAGKGDVWAASSRDYDSLLFGAPRLIRYVTISGSEFLPSKGYARPLEPELIDLEILLSHHGITREQLVDIAILIGTDFNRGVSGVGPKTALKLIKEWGGLDNAPREFAEKLPRDYGEVRRLFRNPEVTDDYELNYSRPDEDGLYRFLCQERGFSRDRVETVVRRLKDSFTSAQPDLSKWCDVAER